MKAQVVFEWRRVLGYCQSERWTVTMLMAGFFVIMWEAQG